MRVLDFGPYRLDLEERQLARGTKAIPLPPRVFDLLAVLVENPGHLLKKQDLLDHVWGDVAVEEGSLTRAISSLRQILGTPDDGGAYIQTVAKLGYRFTADVHNRSIAGAAGTQGGAIAPPRAVLDTPGVAFVGREPELAVMRDTWQRAMAGQRQLVLVAGEPGIGKTRLALEFARACAGEGATVLVGCSDEEALVPYQPFVEALTWYVQACPAADLQAQLAAAGGGDELRSLVPELGRRVPDSPPSPAIDPESRRYRLFESAASMLTAASRSRPLLLVIDDIHWADQATLLMLRHVMRSSAPAPFAIVATYRDTELDRTRPLADMLVNLRREPGVTRMTLHGLPIEHVRSLVDSIVGPGVPLHLAQRVTATTEGNPFFATEILRHLQESGDIGRFAESSPVSAHADDVVLSEGIREVIGRRLSRLTERCNRVLALAAVVGREFDVGVLEAVADIGENELFDALEEAARAQLIADVNQARGRFAFVHALVRQTLYGELSSPRRIRLHSRVAEALEQRAQEMRDPPLTDLAYHFTEAASAGCADKAIEYAIRAGERAADALAHEEAARLFEMALLSIELMPSGASADRLRYDLHRRRARAFEAIGQWTLAIQELEAAIRYLEPEQIEQRCELLLALARTWFLQLDLRPVAQHATDALRLAEQLNRSDLAAHALAWLARCQQAKGDLAATIKMDRDVIARAPNEATATHMIGPLALYLAAESRQGLDVALVGTEAATRSRDTSFIMYSRSHLGLILNSMGRYAEAIEVFQDVRSFGRKYGALPMLARATAMAAGVHLTVFDFQGAEALQAEASELARSVAFIPPVVSAGVDSLLTFARQHEPGRAEQLLEETAASAARIGGWHGWLWQLRLAQARAELALASDAFEQSMAFASDGIEQSRTRRRPKYEALGLLTRARALHGLGRTREAIGDARAAVAIAESIADPALRLLSLDALIVIDGSDDLLRQARETADLIHSALPDDTMRQIFADSEVVQRVRGGRL